MIDCWLTSKVIPAGAVCIVCAIGSVRAENHCVDINNPTPSYPYTNWTTAATNIQDAVNAATGGDTVLVTNGVYSSGTTVTPGYSSLDRVVITNEITVQSVTGPDSTIIMGAPSVRGVFMSAGTLIGFTVTNGQTMTSGNTYYDRSGGAVNLYGGSGVVSNCTLSGNSANYYGGGSYYGTLVGCTFSGNSAPYGGGSYSGTLTDCTFSGNSASTAGGGSYSSTLTACKLSGNSANGDGGGSYNGTLISCVLSGNSANNGGGSYSGWLYSCTVSGNLAAYGGGSYYGNLGNCIVYHNSAFLDGDNHYSATLNYCCTIPMPSTGTGNITDDPLLLDAAHISSNSPCLAAGSPPTSSATDIDGDVWGTPPSIGCDEPVSISGDLEVAIRAAYTNFSVGYAVEFAAEVMGESLSNHWSFGDGGIQENTAYVSHAWSTGGSYAVTLTAYNETHTNGVSAMVWVTVVEDANYYVAIGSTNPVPPYTSWATAATNIQNAVDAAAVNVPGSTVWVGNGVYNSGTTVTPGRVCLNRVVITNEITVRSVAGPEQTIIIGAEASGGGNGPDAVRGVYMSAGALIGFTVTNGYTRNTGYELYDRSGGGVNLYGGNGVVSNCLLFGNSAYSYGGGTCNGTMINCTLSGNSVQNGGGGGSYYGTLTDSVLSGNSVFSYGGGSYYSTLNNCTLSENSAFYGGGSSYGTLTGCTLSNNSASYGGGSYYGTLNGCFLVDNSTSGQGGGVAYASVENCSVIGNQAGVSGGGLYDATAVTCDITDNLSDVGGGAYLGTLDNCSLLGNGAYSDGGGCARATLISCILSNNMALGIGGGADRSFLESCLVVNNAADEGGGADSSSLNNCLVSGNVANFGGGTMFSTNVQSTIAGNTALLGTGGSFDSDHTNCIVYGNNAPVSPEHAFGNWNHSCTDPMPVHGSNNITNNPAFKNPAMGDFRLVAGSPCINTGDNIWSTTPFDLNGNTRIVDGIVDMGAYEYDAAIYDSDADLLVDLAETMTYGTDPLNADSDMDGLTDGAEVAVYATDPLDADTDNDLMPDGWEVANSLNPLLSDAAIDGDGDGFTHFEEYVAGTDPNLAASYFALTNATLAGDEFIIEWNPVAGRTYSTYWSTNLTQGFELLETGMDYPRHSSTNAVYAVEGKCFYRLKVELQN